MLILSISMIFFKEAYKESLKSKGLPVGAVLVKDNNILFRASNQSKINPFLHAEAIVIAEAYDFNIDLSLCEIYVTLEPCLFCASLIKMSRCKKVIFGLSNEKFGALVSENCLCNKKGVYSNINFEQNINYNDLIANNLKNFFLKRR